jgi:CxxC-x17-CxxC domain-containing protein
VIEKRREMKKSIKRKKPAVRHQARQEAIKESGPDMMGLINKMLQQLIVLERKIDALSPLASPPSAAGHRPNMPQRPDVVQRPPERRPDNIHRERILHKAICAECNKECEVPFRPSGDRPVYCKECFAKRRNDARSAKGKPVERPEERVLVYERSFHKDQNIASPKAVEKKKPTARRRK